MPIAIKRGDTKNLRFKFTSNNLQYSFTSSAVSVYPVAGDVYYSNGQMLIITSVSSNIIRALSDTATSLAAVGSITKSVGAGDQIINYTALSSSNTIDITGATLFFGVKQTPTNATNDPNDTTAIIDKKWTNHIDPLNGVSILQLSSTDTAVAIGNYYYELQIINGNVSSTSTDTFTVIQDINIKTS